MTSKYRFVKAHECRAEEQFLNVSPTGAIWDGSNFMACNSKFIAVPWQQLGSAVVLRHDEVGKLASPPHQMVVGHSGNIIDLSFNPFDSNMLVTASEDATIRGWHIPDEGVKERTDKALFELLGHAKKVGCLTWHPSAEGVLASASVDGTVKIWDVNNRKEMYSYKIASDQIISLNFNLDGSQFCATSKDKILGIYDTRTGAQIAKVTAHDGSKAQRSLWNKRRNIIITSGFTNRQHRQIKLWNPADLSAPLHIEEIDQQSAVMMPLLDEDTNMLYLAGKGDGSIMYYEIKDNNTLVRASAYSTSNPQKGLCMMPKSCMHTRKCELARFYKLSAKNIMSISMQMPRRNAETDFQEEVFPPTFAAIPAISAAEFFAGKSAAPLMQDMRGIFEDKADAIIVRADGTVQAAAPVPAAAAAPVEKHEAAPKPAAEETKPAAAEETKPAAAEETKPAAAEETKPAAAEETKPATTEEAVAEWDGESIPTDEQFAKQQITVALLKVQYGAACAIFEAMHAKLPKPEAVEAACKDADIEALKVEEAKVEEAKVEEASKADEAQPVQVSAE